MSWLAATGHQSVAGGVDDFVDLVLADQDWVDAEFVDLVAAAWPDDIVGDESADRRPQPPDEPDVRRRGSRGWTRGAPEPIDGRDPPGRGRAPPH